ncbi:MAG: hypothetical protein LBI67_12405 [Treponema sp.]|jgi:TolA-binding protein|nr:hypothetical protein [Treponema sp.]
MVTLEQIKLLESKITRMIDIVARLNEENARLKKRSEELETLTGKLESEKTRMEEGILSALDRLNRQLEDAIGRSAGSVKGTAAPDAEQSAAQNGPGDIAEKAAVPGVRQAAAPVPGQATAPDAGQGGPKETPVPAKQQTGGLSGGLLSQSRQNIPQAYLIDEEEEDSGTEENEETGEAELDIF